MGQYQQYQKTLQQQQQQQLNQQTFGKMDLSWDWFCAINKLNKQWFFQVFSEFIFIDGQKTITKDNTTQQQGNQQQRNQTDLSWDYVHQPTEITMKFLWKQIWNDFIFIDGQKKNTKRQHNNN